MGCDITQVSRFYCRSGSQGNKTVVRNLTGSCVARTCNTDVIWCPDWVRIYATTKNEKSANHSSPKKPRVACSPRLRMMQDLVSPFLACTRGAAQSVNDEVEPATCCVDNSLKDRIGEPVKEPVWSNWNR